MGLLSEFEMEPLMECLSDSLMDAVKEFGMEKPSLSLDGFSVGV